MLGHAYGPQAYEDPSNFRNYPPHAKQLSILDEELSRSDEVFVTRYRNKYGMNRPPIWAVCEVMSFGLLSRFYTNIRHDRDKKRIAQTYQLSIDVLKSLLEHSVYLRNLCAHHSRLWNRRFTVTVALPTSRPAVLIPNFHPEQDRRLYNSLVLLIHMLRIIEPDSRWPLRLMDHIGRLDPKLIPNMGFPDRLAVTPHLAGNPEQENRPMNPDWLLKHFDQISEAPDAVPRLRRFILDLAVRGKLVEQDPKMSRRGSC